MLNYGWFLYNWTVPRIKSVRAMRFVVVTDLPLNCFDKAGGGGGGCRR